MKFLSSSVVQENFLRSSPEIFVLLIPLALPNAVDEKYFPLIWMVWLLVCILQGSAMGSLRRLSAENNSDHWYRPAVISHTVKLISLLISLITNYTPIFDKTTPLVKMWFVLGVFIPDVYVTTLIMEALKQLRREIQAQEPAASK